MTGQEARRFAALIHGETPDRYGVRLLDHVRRVATAVPAEARTVGWLHEILECTPIGVRELRAVGVSEVELAAVVLLTRDPEADPADYWVHIDRIAHAAGRAGHLARIVKLADLRDRVRHEHQGVAGQARPAYQQALARLAVAPADRSSRSLGRRITSPAIANRPSAAA